jgi:hypothetical protein
MNDAQRKSRPQPESSLMSVGMTLMSVIRQRKGKSRPQQKEKEKVGDKEKVDPGECRDDDKWQTQPESVARGMGSHPLGLTKTTN